MTGSKIVIDIFLRKSPDQEKIAYAILKNLKFESLQTGIHVNESNSISYYFSDKRNLPEKIKKIEKIKEIENFILRPDPRQEILDALSDHDYFKAFALCSTVYEFLAKNILIYHFKRIDLTVNDGRIQNLGLDTAITMLYTHKLIDQSIYSDMVSVNKVRNNFIHFHLLQAIPKKHFRYIVQNIPKLKRSIQKLETIYRQTEIIEIEDY